MLEQTDICIGLWLGHLKSTTVDTESNRWLIAEKNELPQLIICVLYNTNNVSEIQIAQEPFYSMYFLSVHITNRFEILLFF